MRIGPAVHGALLIVALLLAYKTWTKEEDKEQKGGDYVVWSESADSFQSLSYKSKNKDVLIERRSDDTGPYLWGKVTRTRKKVTRPDPHKGIKRAPEPDGAKPGKPGDALKNPNAPPVKRVPLKPKGPAPKGPAPKAPVKKTDAAKKTDGKKANQNDQIEPRKQPAPKVQPKATPKPAGAGPKPAGPAPAGPKPPGPAAGGADPHGHGAHGAPPTAAPSTTKKAPAVDETTVREFPVGVAGDDLVANFSNLRALRKLGKVSEEIKIEYGLDDATDRLTVTFKGGKERSLLVGDRVFGGSDRYVLDEGSGEGYVLASEVMRHVDAAETALGLKKYHAFDEVADLRRLAVEAGGTTAELVRLDLEADKDDKKKKKRTTWARAESENIEDVTMANFVDRVSKLRPVEYLPDQSVAELTKLARFSYRDGKSKELGYMELYKGSADPTKPGAKAEYYMKTEATRVLGRVSRLTAERVDQDLTEIITGDGGEAPIDEGDSGGDQPAPAPTGPTE